MRGLADFIGNAVIIYVLVVAVAMGAINIPMIASLLLGMGTGAHENVTEMRPRLQQQSGNRTYPW